MMLLRMMEEVVRDLGCTAISAAANIGDALAIVENSNIDAATLDVSLHGIFSYPVAAALAARNIPFIFVTGYPKASLPIIYHDRPVLRKPFAYQQAAAAVAYLLSDNV